jgi:carbon monoxide dehydrogenase subunit G
MAVTGTAGCVVRRPVDEVAAFATDPATLLPRIPGVERFADVGAGEAAGAEAWDIFLAVGSLHIGGRVDVSRPDATHLHWTGVRGTDQTFDLTVSPHPDGALLRMTLRVGLRGLLMARIAEVVGRGVIVRHLEAGVQNVRHHLEYGDS